MQYILIEFLNGVQGYQEISFGNVQRYTDLDGNTIPNIGACKVIDANPVLPTWFLPDVVQDVAPIATLRQITKLQYMNRFSDTELVTLYTLAKSNIQIEIWLEKFKLAEFVNLDDPYTIQGVQVLELMGLLSAGRAGEILNA